MVLFSLCEAPLDDWANGSSVDVLSRMVSMVLVLWGYEMKCYIATFQEFHSRYKLFNDMHIGHITVSQWLVIQSSAQVNQDRFPAGQNFIFFLILTLSRFCSRQMGGETAGLIFVIFVVWSALIVGR